ncbi:GAF domain-containing protein [Pedococcus sp. 2YAF34]|uniref:GAF domain-containing protein n=1 Tax=Pedococcus sp. 2YAF34 TaxID=3233032 RepID=UPI003F9A44BA
MTYTVASRPVPEGETWTQAALTELADVPAVHRAGLALAEGGGRRLLFTASDRDLERDAQWCEIDANEDVPLVHAVRTGEAVLGSLENLAARYEAFINRQLPRTKALAFVPVVAAGHVLGAYVLFFETPQRFDQPQVTELAALGARLGLQLRHIQRATMHVSRSLAAEPVPPGAKAADLAVAADLREVGIARHFALITLAAWGVDDVMAGDAILCLSELVTNALLHTEAGCDLRLVLDQGVLTTSVRDGGSTVVVDPGSVAGDPLAVHGRGLQVVDASSTRWGSELDAGGMTVWFVLEPENPHAA